MSDRVDAPVVHTIHGPFAGEMVRFYQRYGRKAHLVAINRSQAQSASAGVRISDVVPNPIAVERWPLRCEKQGYLLWIGRMDPVKGAHRAIEVARLAGRPLVLAGPVQAGQEDYFQKSVEPHVDGRRVHYIGEAGGTSKRELFANAAALLMPVRWREPFEMVMVEALASGTPVIAFPEGAAAEMVIDGENGMLVADEAEMARAVGRVGSVDPVRCRASVAERYDASVTAAGYEDVYRQAIAADRLRATSRARDYARNARQQPARGSTPQHKLMSDRATPASTDQTRPRSVVARDLARVLALLEDDHAGGSRIADCGDRGVQAPAQDAYMLRLAGDDSTASTASTQTGP